MADEPVEQQGRREEAAEPGHAQRGVGRQLELQRDHRERLEERELQWHLKWRPEHRRAGMEEVDPVGVEDEGRVGGLGLAERVHLDQGVVEGGDPRDHRGRGDPRHQRRLPAGGGQPHPHDHHQCGDRQAELLGVPEAVRPVGEPVRGQRHRPQQDGSHEHGEA